MGPGGVGIARTVPAILAVLAAAACGGDEGGAPQGGQPGSGPTTGSGATMTTTPGGAASGTPAPGAGTRIAVTETEYSIRLPGATLTPGTYTFAVDNAGAATHDLVIKGPGVDSARTSQLKGGGKGEVTVTLQPGSYELWCSVGNHRSRGMQTTVTAS